MTVKLPLDLSSLQVKADKLFQLARRIEESDGNGYCTCISCGKRKHYTEMDGGHFIGKGMGGSHLAVRYEKNNCWPQCRGENRFQGGNHSVYRDNLIKKVGLKEVERLEKLKYETVIFKRSLLEQIILQYQWATKGIK